MKKSVAVESSAYLPKKRSAWFKEFKMSYGVMLMFIPGFIALTLFAYKPMYGILIAFKEYKLKLGILGSPWADNHGFAHFIRMFTGGDFIGVLKNTVIISFFKLLLGEPLTVILALCLNEMRNKYYKRVVQTLTYLPHFLSWVILGGIFKMLFSLLGPINSVLMNLGLNEPIPFFGHNGWFRILIVGSSMWQGVGWGAIIYMAALSGIDDSLYEAAYIDGASRWKQTLYITLPSIMGTITTVYIMNLGNVLNAGFDQIYNMYNVLVYESADILDTYSLRLLQDGRYEVGAALGLFKSLVGLTFVLGSNFIIKTLSHDEYGIL
ncbi:MAG: sugar ABC transporter permease [Clostridia bacterium]|nr:sugar ABC transporter permease [Clostridia bacterium]